MMWTLVITVWMGTVDPPTVIKFQHLDAHACSSGIRRAIFEFGGVGQDGIFRVVDATCEKENDPENSPQDPQ